MSWVQPRDNVTKCHCPSSCFVGQSCQPQFHQGHKHMTNLRHTLIPAESKTLSGASLLGINFVLSAAFGGV